MKILGIDPSLSNFGMALVNYDDLLSLTSIDELLLSETGPKDKKDKSVKQNWWDFGRCAYHHEQLQLLLNKNPDCVIAELPHGSQSARAMASYGACLGVISRIQHIPVYAVSAKEVKLAAVGHEEATKTEMIDWAVQKYGDRHFLKSRQGTVIKKNEHLADALAAIEAGLKNPLIRQDIYSKLNVRIAS